MQQAIEGEIEASLFEEGHVDSPNVIMKITERGGADVASAKVGDPLELRFEIFDPESPYEIFVRDLVAKDGNDQVRESERLIGHFKMLWVLCNPMATYGFSDLCFCYCL